MSQSFFSVLLCTYNRPAMLANALRALLLETVEKPTQIVIVNGGDTSADEVVESFRRRALEQSEIEIVLVKTINRNLATSRNVGFPFCTGEIIAMTDDDAQVFPDWVTQIKKAHQEHPEAGAVGGRVIGAEQDSLISRVADTTTFPEWSTPRYVRTLPGVNVSYKRSVIQQIGPQDETLFRGEDVDYNWRVQQLGYRVWFDPRIQVRHTHRATLPGLIRQHYMYGRAYFLVRRKWTEMYCIYPHHVRTPHDVFKALHFFGGLIYQPLLQAAMLKKWRDRIPGYFILVTTGLMWRIGMLRQALLVRTARV